MFYYTSIGLLAVAILMIENHDILFDRAATNNIAARETYRKFLFVVLAYYAVDALWGVLDSLHAASLLFADTTIYYIALASGVLFWTRFVIAYLAEENAFSRFLFDAGHIFFATVLAIVILNCFTPLLFWIEPDGSYHANVARYVLLLIQILLFLLSSLYTFRAMTQTQDALRHSVSGSCRVHSPTGCSLVRAQPSGSRPRRLPSPPPIGA